MIEAFVEPSGESRELAAAEAASAAEALGGGSGAPRVEGLVTVHLPEARDAVRLADRLALAHRCLRGVGRETSVGSAIAQEAALGRSAVFRRLGRSPGATDDGVLAAGRAYREGGGRIDLATPERRFWLGRDLDGGEVLLEEVARVDRRAASARRMPMLPFQRPVSLPPRLARAAANLARVRPGDRVVDPFLGTGALLAEAGLLGGELYGIDRDDAMVRGAVRNFAHLGVSARALVVGDAGEVELPGPPTEFDAIVTDPPYGRSSSTGGEAADRLVGRVLPRWGTRLRPGGRLVVVVPSGAAEMPSPWRPLVSVPVRVHRSLTREFRAYDRPP